jgi:hypothetical protein
MPFQTRLKMHSVLYPREPRLLSSNADMTACLPLQDCIVQTTRQPAVTTGLRYGRKFLPPRCGRIPYCHLQWQDTKLHARGGCCPAAVAGYQTATCRDRIPNCMHAAAVALLQWQNTKLHARVAALL